MIGCYTVGMRDYGKILDQGNNGISAVLLERIYLGWSRALRLESEQVSVILTLRKLLSVSNLFICLYSI